MLATRLLCRLSIGRRSPRGSGNNHIFRRISTCCVPLIQIETAGGRIVGLKKIWRSCARPAGSTEAPSSSKGGRGGTIDSGFGNFLYQVTDGPKVVAVGYAPELEGRECKTRVSAKGTRKAEGREAGGRQEDGK